MRRIAEIYGGRPGPARLHQARALDRRAYRDHRRHGGRRQPVAAARRPRHRLAHLRAASARACSTACSPRASAFRRWRSAAPALFASKAPASPTSRRSCSARTRVIENSAPTLYLWMELGRLLPGEAAALGPVDLGFLAPRPFPLRTLPLMRVGFRGFPWILSVLF